MLINDNNIGLGCYPKLDCLCSESRAGRSVWGGDGGRGDEIVMHVANWDSIVLSFFCFFLFVLLRMLCFV